ncbi:hypothetical protein Tco_0594325, partial [Tanacetum coccineum]
AAETLALISCSIAAAVIGAAAAAATAALAVAEDLLGGNLTGITTHYRIEIDIT